MVADKSDGVRFSLFLCKEGERHFSFLIDRKMTLYQIPVAACKHAFAGSIFDGELLWIRTSQGCYSQLFLIFDVVAFKGQSDIQRQDLHRRLELIRGAFDLSGERVTSPEEATKLARRGKIICGGNAHGLSFRPKQCFPMDQLDTLLRQMSSLQYATDGLIFTPVDAPVGTGTAERTFKLKTRHTVDLEVCAGELLLGQGGSPETATQRVPLEAVGASLRRSPRLTAFVNASVDAPRGEPRSAIIECELVPRGDEIELEFMHARRDKSHPNAIRTLLATVTNLRENIQMDELCAKARSSHYAGERLEAGARKSLPKPVCCEASSQGGAELASVAVGDVLDAHCLLTAA